MSEQYSIEFNETARQTAHELGLDETDYRSVDSISIFEHSMTILLRWWFAIVVYNLISNKGGT